MIGGTTRVWNDANGDFVPQLADGKAPDWLKPLPLPPESGLKLWKITQP